MEINSKLYDIQIQVMKIYNLICASVLIYNKTWFKNTS